jgi:hypothetical protein
MLRLLPLVSAHRHAAEAAVRRRYGGGGGGGSGECECLRVEARVGAW